MNNEITRYQICTQKKKEKEKLSPNAEHVISTEWKELFLPRLRWRFERSVTRKKKKRESTFRMMILRYGKHINLTRECVARRQKKKAGKEETRNQ